MQHSESTGSASVSVLPSKPYSMALDKRFKGMMENNKKSAIGFKMNSPGPFIYKPPSKSTTSKTLNVTNVRDNEDSEEFPHEPRESMKS